MIQNLQAEMRAFQEESGAREAGLKREAEQWRKQSLKHEREIARIQSGYDGKVTELKAARAALAAREERLGQVERRMREADEAVLRDRSQLMKQLQQVAEERDSLKELLAATLKRLEAVDDAVKRADVAQAMAEERVRLLELERTKALNELAMARAELLDFTEVNRQLEHENHILERLTKVKIDKSEAAVRTVRGLMAAEMLSDSRPGSMRYESDFEDDILEAVGAPRPGARPHVPRSLRTSQLLKEAGFASSSSSGS